jgi:two-component system, NtrC family, nitrogen regulation response regulator NtrX
MKVVTATAVVLRSRKRILLVEDDVDLARLYRGVLRMAGFDALHVANGWSALRAIEEESPDLIVLDIHLPGLRGDELLKELSERPDTRQIPAIVVTGTDINLAVAQAKQILRKPCAPERLVSAVERYVEAAA